MLDKVRRTIEKYEMLCRGDRVVVAVSGGVDSVTLLCVLYELKDEWDLELAVAHLDHRMRAGSEEDARFVKAFAQALGLPFIHGVSDVPEYIARERLSPEEAARKVRYRFLVEAAHKLEYNVIALGHQLNDRVETFLINLLRGAGLEGLAGIPPLRVEGDLRYIRPLIECSREEIKAFARKRGLEYREDPTNRDLRYKRNRVRLKLLPLLKEFNPSFIEAVARASETLRKAHEHLRSLADKAFRRALLQETTGEIILSKEDLPEVEILQEYLVREAIRRVKGNLRGIEAIHIEQVLQELGKGRSGAQLNLSEGIRLVTEAERVIFTRRPPRRQREPYRFELRLGENVFAEIGWRFDLSVLEGSPLDVEPHDRLEARLDYDKIIRPLWVRNRRPGDRFDPLGLGGTKKLQDFFVDAKIPRDSRDEIPLICDSDGIIWVVGWAVSERCRLSGSTRRTLRIRATPLREGES